MLSTLSKWRILARMMYPQYIQYEERLIETDKSVGFHFDFGAYIWYICSDKNFGIYVGNTRLNQVTPNENWPMRDKAIFAFQKAERNAKGNESIFAPRRREPGVVE